MHARTHAQTDNIASSRAPVGAKKYICFPYFCYWITRNQIDHLVKRVSIKAVIFFAMSWRKLKKRRLIFRPPGMNGLIFISIANIFIPSDRHHQKIYCYIPGK